MSVDPLQRNLNDYLDDRLGADERKRFEERLAGDAELARQLATEQEIRKELRSGEEELSAAFYTRAAAHFSAKRRRLPWGLSWSTAGLAVATIAAAVIFVPSILRQEIPDMPVEPQAQEEGLQSPEKSRSEKGERAAGEIQSSLESMGNVVGEDAAADHSKGDLLSRESSIDAVESKTQKVVGGLAENERKRQAAAKPKSAATPPPPIAQAPRRQVTNESIPEPLSSVDEATEPVEMELEERALGKGHASQADPADGLELDANFKDADRVDASQLDKKLDSDTVTTSGYFQRGALLSAVELNVDLAGAGEIELLDARDARLQVAAGRKKENKFVADSTAPVPAAAANRFVAIGRRPGLDACAALTVRRTDKTWEITYEDSGSSVGSVSCGIEIPDDGVRIRFQGWPLDE